MARKPPPAPTVKPRLELNEPAATARPKLADRITKGTELRDRQPRTQSDIEKLKQEHGKWGDYNALLLRTMFSTPEIEEEYLGSGYSGNLHISLDGYGRGGNDLEQLHNQIVGELACLESIIERLGLLPLAAGVVAAAPGAPQRAKDFGRAFVVHGHDEGARESVARFLEKLGVTPVILHEQANRGKTLIEKLEHYGDVAFAVVLLTPDDEGRAMLPAGAQLKPRARQNVLLELGYFVGLLGRSNVCALHKEGLELPSDWDGVAWVGIDARGAWKLELARELKAAGFRIDMNDAS